MMEMLRVTGVFGFDLVVPHMSDTEVRKRFIKAFEEVERVGERRQPYEWFQALVDVHLLINDVADNIYLRSIWKGFHLTHFNRMLAEKLPGPHWERYIANYRALGETILSDKPERAGKLFNSHMQWALKLLNDLHESKPDSSRLRT
jgi:DNA-binding GntR family transcriptional regulator